LFLIAVLLSFLFLSRLFYFSFSYLNHLFALCPKTGRTGLEYAKEGKYREAKEMYIREMDSARKSLRLQKVVPWGRGFGSG